MTDLLDRFSIGRSAFRRVARRPLALLAMLAVVGCSAVFAVVAVAGPARADEGGYFITAYDVALDLHANGDLAVNETIAVRFDQPRHGLYRYVPFRLYLDDVYDRESKIDKPTITSAGASGKFATKTEGRNRVWRIGDKDRTVTGPVTYRISYVVHDIVTPGIEPGTGRLSWNAFGDGWNVTIPKPTVTLALPGKPSATRCFAGPGGSTSACATKSFDGVVARFGQPFLTSGNFLTVEADLPSGTIVPTPVVHRYERFDFVRRLGATKSNQTLAGGMAVASLLGVGVVATRKGRDANYVRGTLDTKEQGQAVGTVVVKGGPVEYRPPDDIAPALLGALIDESADISDVNATIIDLAVRGYLTIEETEEGRFRKKKDWVLTETAEGSRQRPADGTAALAGFEKRIYDKLFAGSTSVAISSLKNTFATTMSATQADLYKLMVARGWYKRDPKATRARWAGLGVLVLVVGGGLFVLLLKVSHHAILAAPIAAVGVAMIATSKRMPSRTPQGSAMYARVLGFEKFLKTADGDQLRFVEQQGLLDRMLPYAVVLGITSQWTKRLAKLGLYDASPIWYSSGRPFDAGGFGSDLGNFLGTAGTTLSSSPSSSGGSGGSSGGGGGGGGGGSW